ncbi:hypothetical protein P5673_031361 [Acropora cervicornis]|uniref:Uncharacterized protein n=1 Tax=Acropora cervicornis TaxID=6130 RepID=A0AAD9PT88_ACRCE|nr:hypothetical protein P5673_031361 [Acropora cervicornis]
MSASERDNIKILVMLVRRKFLKRTAQRRIFPNSVAKLMITKKPASIPTTAGERDCKTLEKILSWSKFMEILSCFADILNLLRIRNFLADPCYLSCASSTLQKLRIKTVINNTVADVLAVTEVMCTWLLCVNSSANMRVRAREPNEIALAIKCPQIR